MRWLAVCCILFGGASARLDAHNSRDLRWFSGRFVQLERDLNTAQEMVTQAMTAAEAAGDSVEVELDEDVLQELDESADRVLDASETLTAVAGGDSTEQNIAESDLVDAEMQLEELIAQAEEMASRSRKRCRKRCRPPRRVRPCVRVAVSRAF